jgi:hypothetical protein
MDRVMLSALAMPAPPDGSQYEVWLTGSSEETRRSLGVLELDGAGKGTLIYEDESGQNLLAVFDGVEVRVRPEDESSSEIPSQIAYAYTLPGSGLEYTRRLLVSFSLAPDRVALMQGLSEYSAGIEQAAREMQSAYEEGDQVAARRRRKPS